ncbi:MAG: hypothetical protein ACFE9S_01595 [Candidatus Hermodarchaeota archaeon]
MVIKVGNCAGCFFLFIGFVVLYFAIGILANPEMMANPLGGVFGYMYLMVSIVLFTLGVIHLVLWGRHSN